MAAATEGPSRTRAGIRASLPDNGRPAGGALERPQLVQVAQDDQLIARLHHRVRWWIEFHAAVAALNAYHNHAEALAQVGFQDGPSREHGAFPDPDLFHVQLDVLGTRRDLHE